MNSSLLHQGLMVIVLVVVAQFSYADNIGDTNSINHNSTKQTQVTGDNKAIGGDFTLTDHNGKPFTLKSQRGKLVLMFFGYTYCPDICPTELSILSRMLKSLDKDVDKVTALFITVDPERDTADKLKNYVHYYSPHLIGLTGSREDIDKVAKAYHVQYKIHPHKPEDKYYIVDHSASLFVVNHQGKLDQIIPFGLPVAHIQSVINEKLATME